MKEGHPSKKWLLVLPMVLAGIGLRLAYLVHLLPVCRSDEAVFGLMTKHLLEGRALPVYLYEAHYAGALICYLAAIPFSVFGISMPALKLTTYLFSIPTIILVFFLARKMADLRVAVLAACFMALPPILVTWTGQYAGGGYPETLFFGTLSLLVTLCLLDAKHPWAECLWGSLLGFLNGVGTWILFSMIPYTLTTWTFLLMQRTSVKLKKLAFAFFIGYVIGILPLVFYNIQHPFATFLRLGAGVMDVERGEVTGKETSELASLAASKMGTKFLAFPNSLLQIIQNVWQMMRLDSSFGILSTFWDLLSLAGLLLLLWKILAQRRRLKGPLLLLPLLLAWMVLFLAATGLTKTRYITFLYPPFVIFLAWILIKGGVQRWFGLSFTVLFLGSNLLNHGLALRTPEAEDRFTELVSVLEAKGLRYGYSDYVTAYPVSFLTGERILVSPIAGPLNVERIPDYTEKVDQAEDIFFVFEKDSEAAGRFEEALGKRKISFKREEILRHALYTEFSKRPDVRTLPLVRLFPGDRS